MVALAKISRAGAAEVAPVPFKPPRLVHFVEAVLPTAPAAAREAEVVLSLDVDEAGKVSAVEVAKPAGGEGGEALDQAAVAAARQFVFEPGVADGHPVAVRVTYSYRFVFKPDLRPPPSPAPNGGLAPHVPTVPLSGLVRRRGNRTAVTGAVALVTVAPGDERRAVTDEQGRFAFAALPVGEHKLALRGATILPVDITVALHEGKSTELDLFVDVKERYASTVRGQRAVVETVEQTLTAEEIQRIPGTQGDTLKAVQNLPGVARAPFGIGLLPVWGSAPAGHARLRRRRRHPALYHFGGLRSTVNSEMVAALTFVPGGYQADHGRGLGGIVDIETPPAAHRRAARLRADRPHRRLAHARGAAHQERCRSPWPGGAAGSTPPCRCSRPARFQLSPVYYDYQARLSWRPHSARDDVDLFLFGSDDQLKLVGARSRTTRSSATVDSHTYFHRGLVSWAHRFERGAHAHGHAVGRLRRPLRPGRARSATTPTSLDAAHLRLRDARRAPLADHQHGSASTAASTSRANRWQIDRAGSPAAVTDLAGGTGARRPRRQRRIQRRGSGYAVDHLTALHQQRRAVRDRHAGALRASASPSRRSFACRS